MRLIDADKLDYNIIHNPDDDDEYMRFITDFDIENAPTIDAVEVVRCKDCKYHITHDRMNGCKIWWGWANDDNRFCSYGERSEEV